MKNQINTSSLLYEIRTIEAVYYVDRKKFFTDSLILLVPSAKIKLAPKSGGATKLYKKGNVFSPSGLSQYIDWVE